MSAQLKSFEGPDVQLLLDGIRQELGPGAKIDRAERIRVGGLFGFFAKEHYRVFVEVPGPADAHDAPAAADENLSRRARRKNATVEPTSAAPSLPTVAATDVFRAMAEATDDVNEVGNPAVTQPAVTQPAVTQPPVAEPALTAPPLMTAPPTQALTPAPRPATEPARAVPAESFDAVLTRVASTLEPSPPGRPAAGFPPGPGPASPTGDPPDVDDTLPPADIVSGAALFLAENGSGPSATSMAEPPAPAAPKVTATPTVTPAPKMTPAVGPHDALVSALGRVGLDGPAQAALQDGLRRGTGLETLLFELFADLPVAPPLPRRPGSLLVVVGDAVAAQRLGCALAGEIGADPAEVPFASRAANAHIVATGPLLVRSAEEAAERAPGWRRSRAAVVVVEAGVNGSERSWATHLIGALRPTGVWGVAEATAKIEDISAWAENLGGIDALALENLDATVSPVAALATGLPVARIDGQPTTAARWVATVMDRMVPCR